MSWTWRAIYKDGSSYDEGDIAPSQLDRAQVTEVQLFYEEELKLALDFDKNEAQNLILFRRTKKDFRSGDNGEELLGEYVTYFVGWKEPQSGVKSILELHPNGLVIMRNRDGRAD